MLGWRGVGLGLLLVAVLAASGQTAAQATEETVSIGLGEHVASATEALDTVDEDRDGIPDAVEPLLCLAAEDPDVGEVIGDCTGDVAALQGDYHSPIPIQRDELPERYPEPIRETVCIKMTLGPLNNCEGPELPYMGGNAVVVTIRATSGGLQDTGCAGDPVEAGTPDDATCLFVSVAVDLDQDGDAGAGEAVSVACLTNGTECIAANPYLVHHITFTTEPTEERDAVAPTVTITESSPGEHTLVGDHSIRLCVPDDAEEPTDPDVLRVKGCAEDLDEDGRLLHQELLLCSDPTDPGSDEPPAPEDYPLECWPANRSGPAADLAGAILDDAIAAAGIPDPGDEA